MTIRKWSGICQVSREAADGTTEYLVVWNRKKKVWCMPGGKVEPGEHVTLGALRELQEETGIEAIDFEFLVEMPSSADPTRQVAVYVVSTFNGVPREMERGCPVTWMTKEDFLAGPHFTPFYDMLLDEES
jgi:8-oxo-dGTP pyrophosphatase MutT (NUDIX family)